MARPTTLDESTARTILDALRAGCSIRVACKAAGVGQTTFKTWVARGKSRADEDAPYRAFRADVRKARSAGEAAALKVIHEAMPDHWQAAAWFLERSKPARWGKVDRIKAEEREAMRAKAGDPDDGFDWSKLSRDEMRTVLALIRKASTRPKLAGFPPAPANADV